MTAAFLLENALKATLILLAAFAASFALRRASAAARHLLWTSAVLGLLALPILSLALPAWRAPLPAGMVEAVQPAAPPSAAVPAPVPPAPVAVVPASSWQAWIVAIWAAGLLVAVARLVAGIARVEWLAHHARRRDLPGGNSLFAELGLRRPVSFLESDRAVMPMTWGFRRPVILLPAAAREWSGERLRLVLAHELIHVKRHDWLTQLLSRLACALYWFHPLAWLAAAECRRERERACDDAVLRLGIKGSDYAGHLLDLVRSLALSPRCAVAVAMAQPAHLESRLKAMLNPGLKRTALTGRSVALAALAAAALVLPLAVLRDARGAQAPRPTGKIAGTVYDASGAVVPGAVVTASNLDTGGLETATANAAGDYQFAAIPAGRYTLEARQRGFALLQQKDVVLEAHAELRLNLSLQIGSVTETIEVVGKAPQPAAPTSGAAPQRIRVGGNVQATRLLSAAKPIYPEWLQAQGIQGPVVLRAVIGVDGSLLSLSVINTPADPALAQAALDAVKQWRYQPTLLNGHRSRWRLRSR